MREAVVAGLFYPGESEGLRQALTGLWPSDAEVNPRAVGALLPHAGYVYSGRTAARVVANLPRAERYLLLGPNHTGLGAAIAVSAETAWSTPLGPVPVDAALARRLTELCPEAELDDLAHTQEHSLEVLLPFLQYHRTEFAIVPVALGTQDPSALRALARALAQCVQGAGSKVLVLASSDMNHFKNLERTKVLDQLALEQVLKLDPEGLLQTVHQHRISMCGAGPAAAMLWACQDLGAKRAELVHYSTSAEASGDTGRVVGYAGVIVQ